MLGRPISAKLEGAYQNHDRGTLKWGGEATLPHIARQRGEKPDCRDRASA